MALKGFPDYYTGRRRRSVMVDSKLKEEVIKFLTYFELEKKELAERCIDYNIQPKPLWSKTQYIDAIAKHIFKDILK